MALAPGFAWLQADWSALKTPLASCPQGFVVFFLGGGDNNFNIGSSMQECSKFYS